MSLMTGEGIEVYEDNAELYLSEYQESKGVSCYDIDQGRWNSVLLYIYKHVFAISDSDIKYNNRKSNIDYRNHDLVNGVCDMYINLCYEYSKEVSILGFCKLTGIAPDTIYCWGNETSRAYDYYDSKGDKIDCLSEWVIQHQTEKYTQRLGSSYSDIYKKLSAEREESLSGKLVSGKGNPVGILGVLNRNYGWNMGQPKGLDGGRQARTPEQIAADYNVPELPDGQEKSP